MLGVLEGIDEVLMCRFCLLNILSSILFYEGDIWECIALFIKFSWFTFKYFSSEFFHSILSVDFSLLLFEFSLFRENILLLVSLFKGYWVIDYLLFLFLKDLKISMCFDLSVGLKFNTSFSSPRIDFRLTSGSQA